MHKDYTSYNIGVVEGAIIDGFKPGACDTPCDGCCYKVMLFTGQADDYVKVDENTTTTVSRKDFHWYRQDKGGCWSGKPGLQPITNKDGDSKIIPDPRQANNQYKFDRVDVDYFNFGGCFCVPRWGIRTMCN